MEPFYSNDSFEAFRTEDGIQLIEKKVAAKKLSIIIIAMGAIFLAISFIPLEGLTFDWITSIFHGVFFYGGIVLLVAGVLTLVLKGMGNKEGASTTLNKHTRILTLRKKEIPFSEMGAIKAETNEVMKRNLTALLFKQNDKKKAFIGGAMLNVDLEGLETFLEEVNALVAGEVENAESSEKTES